ncbi:MAG: autotransporter outer membrane beta-barrel domain-containing protein [Proteobacteria bacterium]|nr:autotransporter outer membrane beta-barrel domain-containing protein [Pseudomonadota bacterium]
MQAATPIRGGASHALLALAATAGLTAAAQAQSARPETGALLGMQRMTDLIFVHTLDDRGGSARGAESSAWFRTFGESNSSTSDSGLNDVDGKAWGLQGGFDLPGPRRLTNWRFGVMGSLGTASADGSMAGSGLTSRGRGDGGGIGLYGTWFQDPASRLGWYADLWGHFAWFNNRVDTSGLARNTYGSHNGSGSAEGGYAFSLGGENAWTLTPQLQWLYVHNHSYNFTESDGTSVEGAHRGNSTYRVGLRLQQSQAAAPSGATGLRPYVAVNWWHGASGDEVVYDKTVSVKDLYPQDRFELKGGGAVAIGRQWRLWGDLGWQTGNQSFSAWTAQFGARYGW